MLSRRNIKRIVRLHNNKNLYPRLNTNSLMRIKPVIESNGLLTNIPVQTFVMDPPSIHRSFECKQNNLE